MPPLMSRGPAPQTGGPRSAPRRSPEQSGSALPGLASLAQRGHRTGFTLIELLVVLVIAGAALALVVVQATPNEQSRLRDDGEKIARLFALADEEAQLRAQPLAWEGDTRGWRFLTQRGNDTPVLLRDVLAPGAWTRPLDAVRLTRGTNALAPRLVFGEETISQPFRLTLVRAGLSTTIVSDGAGTYRTETP